MEFVLIMLADREAPDDPSIYPEMGRFAGELAGSGKLRGGAPLHPEAEGARVTGADRQRTVSLARGDRRLFRDRLQEPRGGDRDRQALPACARRHRRGAAARADGSAAVSRSRKKAPRKKTGKKKKAPARRKKR